jgi:hypothetical protein
MSNQRLKALNMAYGILMDHCLCLAEDVPLDGLAEDIANAILNGPTGDPRVTIKSLPVDRG